MPELSPLARLEHAEALHVLDVGTRDEGSVAGPGQHDQRAPGRRPAPASRSRSARACSRSSAFSASTLSTTTTAALPSRSTRMAISRPPANRAESVPPGGPPS